MSGASAYVFDAYGTLFDVHAAITRHRAAAGPDADRFSEIWRVKQLEYAWTLTLAGHYADFWTLTERALDYAFDRVPTVSRALRTKLLDAYLTLDAFADARAALTELKARGRCIAILSNGTPHMLQAAVQASGIAPLCDAIACISRGRKSTRSLPIVSASPRTKWRSSHPTGGISWARPRSASARCGSIVHRRRKSIRTSCRPTPCPICRRCDRLSSDR
jgi:2-haloacid dehalogenase